MKTFFQENSPLLDDTSLTDALRAAMEKSLEEYVEEVKDHQDNGVHSGVVRNVKINGEVISHQASRVGESPAPISGFLRNSTTGEMISEYLGEVTVTAPYAGILVKELERDVLETPEKNYAPRFQKNVEEAIKELL